MIKEVVIARYKEDLNWISNLDQSMFSMTYNKFYEEDHLSGNNASFYIPNIGNEANTYLYHIVHNWNSLSDITFFVQGHPLDHSKDIVEQINRTTLEDLKPSGFIHFCDFITTSGATGEPHHPDNPIPVKEVYEDLFGDFPITLLFGAGAQFAITKECIRKRPLAFYKKLLLMSELPDKTAKNELVMPMVLERLWGKIFE